MALVLISGGMGTGKTTLANRLWAEWHMQRFSLAAELKRRVGDWYGIDPATINDPEVKNNIRPTLQAVGQYWRAMNEDYWCEQLADALPYDSCIDDVRFYNEVDFFVCEAGHERFGEVVHIHLASDWTYAIDFAMFRGATREQAEAVTSEVSETEARQLHIKSPNLIAIPADNWTPERDEQIYKEVFDYLFDKGLTPIG